MTMTVNDWLSVPDYPANREVGKRINKPHLKGDLKSAAMETVCAVSIGGRLMKIDGHSRAAAWEAGTLSAPNEVSVIIYYVSCMNEAHDLYDSFTAKTTAATASEESYTANKRIGFNPQSKLCQSSWKSAFNMHGFKTQEEGMKHFFPEMQIIDSWMVNQSRSQFWSVGVRGAMLLSLKEDPEVAIRFWDLYRNENSNDQFVNRLKETIEDLDGVSGGIPILRVYTSAVGAFNSFKADNR